MTKIIFDNVSRNLELLVSGAGGSEQRGQLNLARVLKENGDFILEGTGLGSGKVHRFKLSDLREIIDMESGENVDIAEFHTELESHRG